MNEAERETRRSLSVLALARTAYSSERALLAWIRTSISLYTFGFAISKFLDYLKMQQTGVEFSLGLRRLGFVLICLGVLSLVLAGAEHVKRIKRMRQLGLPTTPWPSLPLGTAVALVAIGVVTLVGLLGGWSP
jgi:putative membrane protein